jgi:hypothetical protein
MGILGADFQTQQCTTLSVPILKVNSALNTEAYDTFSKDLLQWFL